MRNRLRSVLTMLGIVWGLAWVVILLAYGQGSGGSVLRAFMNMGNNVIVMWPGAFFRGNAKAYETPIVPSAQCT